MTVKKQQQIAVISVFATMIAISLGFLGTQIVGRKPVVLVGAALFGVGAAVQVARKD
ncbi:MAG: hypothetical protein PUP93_14455 [Rhizonema sp. NSF051]|nr:hypothetical protein [Rhizonema sp. NSF051]